MTSNSFKRLVTAGLLLLATCVILAVVLLVYNGGSDWVVASQSNTLPSEVFPILDWSVYRAW